MGWFDKRFAAAKKEGFEINGDCQRPSLFYIKIPITIEVCFNLIETANMDEKQFVEFLRKRIKDGIFKGRIIRYIGNLPTRIFVDGD